MLRQVNPEQSALLRTATRARIFRPTLILAMLAALCVVAVTNYATSAAATGLYTDSFEGDAIGSIPAGWTVNGTNAGFTVQQQGSHVYDHNGWTATTTAGNP